MISACIVNWNTRDHLRQCLESLRASAVPGELQVIVVDNASEDGSAEMAEADFPWATLIANETNRGYAEGNNQAIEAATGEYIALLNPDVALPSDGLARMASFLDGRPEAAAVAPRLILPNGSVQRSVRRFPTPWTIFCEATLLSRIFRRSERFASYWMPEFAYDEAREIDQPMTSCVLFRAEVLREAGGFDTDFPIYFNDVDLFFRLSQAGQRAYFLPDVEVAHHHGASTRQVWRKMIRASNRDLLTFCRKHHRPRMHALAYWGLVALVRVSGFMRWLIAPRRSG